MIDFASLEVIDSVNGRTFKLKGVEYSLIKHILKELMILGLTESNAMAIISEKCKNKQKELK